MQKPWDLPRTKPPLYFNITVLLTALMKSKKNYDGYAFAGIEIYCPWDVIKFCEAAIASKRQKRDVNYGNYWVSSSGNDIIRQFLDALSPKDVGIMQQLLDGKV